VQYPFRQNTVFDFDNFWRVVQIAQRLMDDLIDLELEKIDSIIAKIESDPEPLDLKRVELELWKAIREKCITGRRTGLGITGLADMFAALNIPYSSKKAIRTADEIFRFFKHAAFDASCELAKELGPFPIWDWERDKKSEFIQQIKEENPELYAKIQKYGRRNIGLLTIAPTGSVSIETQTSSGGEPVFAPFHIRRKKVNPSDKGVHVDFVDEKGDHWQHFKVFHPPLDMWMKETGESDITKSPYHGNYSADIDWETRVELQAALQKHIDHAISSTVNLPETATEADVARIYTKAWKSGCKGITVYREGSRSGVLIKNEKKSFQIIKTNAPKRPEKVRGEIFATAYKKEKLYVAVGFDDNNNPYEVFCGNNVKDIVKNAKGFIYKSSRGKYLFLCDNGHEYHLTNGLNDENADALTRAISGGLRHGEDIGFVVHQLEKTEGDLLSFSKVLARVLKKFITNGTQITGESCMQCGGNLRRDNGCKICISCGWSACS
jgi:ribonucleoside-diphosphate reductase alpha chain